MQDTISEQAPTAAQLPVCVACLGDQINPTTRDTCRRCHGTGIDPDPGAPTGIAVLP